VTGFSSVRAAPACISAAIVPLVLLAWSTPVPAQTLGPGARPFSACVRIPDATRLDALRRPGIDAVRCRIGLNLQFAVLSDETVSWPVIIGAGALVSLEDPFAKRTWFPNASPVRIRPGRERFLTVRGADGAPLAIVYSAFASRTDGPGVIDAYVALRLRPRSCLLGVTRDAAAALRLARGASAPCIPPFERG
jgi:hypothetical protein